MKKLNFQLTEITAQQAIDSKNNEYNYSIWKENVNRYSKYKDVKFYESNVEEYGNFPIYVVYTLPEGLRIMNQIKYSAMLHNGGFSKIDITPEGTVFVSGFNKLTNDFDGVGEGRAENSPRNRKILSNYSSKFGYIFSNNY